MQAIRVLCLLFLSWCFNHLVERAEATHPNVVFILADDLGYGDLGCYGRKDIETPQLDQLAREGVRLTSHYANGPECSPTRAAFLTGRYQQRIGGLECAIGTGNVGRYDDAIRLRETNDLGLPTGEPSIAKSLAKAGYTTAIFGKWHLGYEGKFAPQHHGFQETFYCVGGGMDYFHYLDTVAGYNLFRDGRPVSANGYFTDLMTDEAIRFLERQDGAKPFFLYLPYTCPHSPFQGPLDQQPDPLPLDSPLWNQGTAPKDTYIAMIEHMDKRIGDVLAVLEKRGFKQTTIVVFAGDNGGTRSARNTPLSGIKGSTYEGGIRVPGIIRWPEHIGAGTINDEPNLTFDFTRSFAELAGVPADPQKPLEGVTLIQNLAAKNPLPERSLFWRKQRGERVWKAVRNGKWKYVATTTPSEEKAYLYDLSTDISEQRDLAKTQRDEFTKLQRMYLAWETEVRRNRRGQP